MKEKIEGLYFVKCRHCIMDIINSIYIADKEIIPRPDYVDYYAIVKKKDDNLFVNLFNKKENQVHSYNLKNIETYYDSDIILSLTPLSNYIKDMTQ